MSDAKDALGRTNRPPASTTAKQFTEWCALEQERRRARDVELNESLYADAVALVERRLVARERGR